jgi:thiol:disulfide interchange protein DsbC
MNRTLLSLVLLVILVCTPCVVHAALDLDKAVKVGSGKTMVIEFTDPDCPFCRKGSAYFHNRSDVTRYIILNPLPMHPNAREKAEYILSAQDKAKAYEEVLSGKMDGKKPEGIRKEGIKLLEDHLAMAREEKAVSTPTYLIYGRIIKGFNQQLIEELIGKK